MKERPRRRKKQINHPHNRGSRRIQLRSVKVWRKGIFTGGRGNQGCNSESAAFFAPFEGVKDIPGFLGEGNTNLKEEKENEPQIEEGIRKLAKLAKGGVVRTSLRENTTRRRRKNE